MCDRGTIFASTDTEPETLNRVKKLGENQNVTLCFSKSCPRSNPISLPRHYLTEIFGSRYEYFAQWNILEWRGNDEVMARYLATENPLYTREVSRVCALILTLAPTLKDII